MKDFVKYTLATLTGIVLSFLFFLIVGIVMFAGLMVGGQTAPGVQPQTVLHISLSGKLKEDVIDNPMAELLGDSYKEISLKSLLSAIKTAETDNRISGIFLEAGSFLVESPAMTEELRDALLSFKKSGKFVAAYGDNYSQNCYYLCSVADCVALNPQGQLDWCGMAAQPVFFKELLEKIGVRMQVFKVGAYKSAVEPYTLTQMSDENRRQVSSYLNDIWTKILSDVSASRHVDTLRLNRYADEMLAFVSAEELVKKGMVDTLCYMDGVEHLLDRMNGGSHRMISVDDWLLVPVNKKTQKNKVAVYYAYGDIVDQSDEWMEDVIDGKSMCRDLKDLRKDNSIKAVVLRLNSGGGSAYASEQIWHEVRELSKVKPVVVSMGGMAASGAYYLASAANYIYAQPTTLTGSIGIFGLVPDGSELLGKKLGLTFDAVKTNRHSDFGTIARPFNAEERSLMQGYVQKGYNLFMRRVAEGRNLSVKQVDGIAQGRVWTGKQALTHGLVDETGSLQDAITKATALAKLQTYSVETYPLPEPWYGYLLDKQKKHYLDSYARETIGEYYGILMNWRTVARSNQLQARLPYALNLINWN